MAIKRVPSGPPLAMALDGSLLLDVRGQIDPALLSKLARALSVGTSELFVGTRLSPARRRQALTRLDDAAAEAAARLQGLGAKSSSRGRLRKTNKKV